MNRTLRIACAVALSQLVAACVPMLVPLRTPHQFDPKASYLYGRFPAERSGPVGHHFMGLIVGNEKRKRALPVGEEEPKMFAVKPGKYAIRGLKCGEEDLDYVEQGGQSTEFVVEPGKAYYIGDFHTRMDSRYEEANRFGLLCGVVDVKHAYAETTAVLKKQVPGLARMETVDVAEVPGVLGVRLRPPGPDRVPARPDGVR